MKLVTIATLVLAASAQFVQGAIGIGDSMTDMDVEMKNIDGSMVSIGSVKGENGTLVIFTCNHCPFVKGWQKEMVAIGNKYQAKEVGVVFINSNDPSAKGDTFEGMQAMASAEGYEFPYVVDDTSDIARHFGATKTPDVFLFNSEDKLVYQGAVGEGGQTPKDDGTPYLRNALDALIADQEIELRTTKAVGCSIKFR